MHLIFRLSPLTRPFLSRVPCSNYRRAWAINTRTITTIPPFTIHHFTMRQRITFLHRPQDAVDPRSFKVTGSSLTGPVLPSVREDRVTLALDELPLELRQLLQSCHELHIRWVSPFSYDTVSPLLSRLSPGFHLFYTPQSESQVQE